MKKILLVFGTRPEAIKMCPLVRELKKRRELKTLVCVSGQHKELLGEVLAAFAVASDYDLGIMKEGQTLFDVTEGILSRLKFVLEQERPDTVVVHGDTSTAFAAALACFYLHIPVAHVEAGLRTYDMEAPFPEEFNRRAISLSARYHFAPTPLCRDNLLREGVNEKTIFVTGNTAVDALKMTVKKDYSHPILARAQSKRLLLFTAHRRENHGEPLRRALRALRRIVSDTPDLYAVYPMHPSPEVRRAATNELREAERIYPCEPLGVTDFHNFIAKSYMIFTDSGGVQEEAAALSKPTLVLRDVTERPEGVDVGVLRPVGTDEEKIYQTAKKILEDASVYHTMASSPNPYGDGHASRRIADILCRF